MEAASFPVRASTNLVGIGPAFTRIGGGAVDLTADFHFERAVGRHGGEPDFSVPGRAVRIGLAGHFDFDVVAGDRRQDFPVAEIERQRVVFGIDSGVEAESVAVLDGVVPAAREQTAARTAAPITNRFFMVSLSFRFAFFPAYGAFAG